MSVTNTRPRSSVRDWVKYVTSEKSETSYEKYDRVVYYSSDYGDKKSTVESIEALLSDTRRKNQGASIIQSFSADELSRDKKWDVFTAHSAGSELAHRLAPSSPAVVVTHVDGKSGCIHNHIFVANHDLETGKALRGAAWYGKALQKVNDEVMRDYGLQVTQRSELALDYQRAKAKQRGEPHETQRDGKPLPVEELTKGNWVEWAAERIDESLMDERVHDLDSLQAVALEKGVSIRTKTSRKDRERGRKPSMTYALVDENGNVRTTSKSKFAASQKRFGTDYTYDGLNTTISEISKQRQQLSKEARPHEPSSEQVQAAAEYRSEQRQQAFANFDKLRASTERGRADLERVDREESQSDGQSGLSLWRRHDGQPVQSPSKPSGRKCTDSRQSSGESTALAKGREQHEPDPALQAQQRQIRERALRAKTDNQGAKKSSKRSGSDRLEYFRRLREMQQAADERSRGYDGLSL